MPSDDFIFELISPIGSAVRETKLTLPDSLKQAIIESLERGKQAGRDAAAEVASTETETKREKVG